MLASSKKDGETSLGLIPRGISDRYERGSIIGHGQFAVVYEV